MYEVEGVATALSFSHYSCLPFCFHVTIVFLSFIFKKCLHRFSISPEGATLVLTIIASYWIRILHPVFIKDSDTKDTKKFCGFASTFYRLWKIHPFGSRGVASPECGWRRSLHPRLFSPFTRNMNCLPGVFPLTKRCKLSLSLWFLILYLLKSYFLLDTFLPCR